MKNLLKVVLLALCIPVFMACPSEIGEFDIDFGYEFYPIDKGYYWEYKVDSVIYTDLGATVDSTTSFIREDIVEQFVDQTNDTIYRIERRFKTDASAEGYPTDEWATSVNESLVTRTEENLKYIKLVFPLDDDTSWEGNAFINENTIINVAGESLVLFIEWDYKVLSRNAEEIIGGITYSDVITVQNADNFNPDLPVSEQNKLERRVVIEKYAKDIGLIYKRHMILDTQCLTEECETTPWEEKAEKGYIMEMTLVDYGK
jgi:hypothetical protein